jgi:hypothetical protein
MEDFMVHLFEDCNLCAIHAKRVTISACLAASLAVHPGCIADQHVLPLSAKGLAAGAAHPGTRVWRERVVSQRTLNIACNHVQNNTDG